MEEEYLPRAKQALVKPRFLPFHPFLKPPHLERLVPSPPYRLLNLLRVAPLARPHHLRLQEES